LPIFFKKRLGFFGEQKNLLRFKVNKCVIKIIIIMNKLINLTTVLLLTMLSCQNENDKPFLSSGELENQILNTSDFHEYYNQYLLNFEGSTKLLSNEEITIEALNNPTDSVLITVQNLLKDYNVNFEKERLIKIDLKNKLHSDFNFKDADFERAVQKVVLETYKNNFNSNSRICCTPPGSIDLMRCYNDCDAHADARFEDEEGFVDDNARNNYKLGCYKGCNLANDQLN